MTSKHIAFICPRFSETATIGGAETLLKHMAEHAARAGYAVDFLTTCAENHFTWENTVPAGVRQVGPLKVHFFPVNEDRNLEVFLRIQGTISNRGHLTGADEEAWIANSVNSRALNEHLRAHGSEYEFIILGPYLFGLTYFAAQVHPEKSILVPCLHDESFAYLDIMQTMFRGVGGFMFNAEPERDLARRLYDIPEERCTVVGMGLDGFEADATAFGKRHGLTRPYILYSGRREPLKGTPLLIDYFEAFRARIGRDIMLVFTGSGPIDAPPELMPHILDVGFVSEQEKHEAMAGAVAFCHPSVNESFGIVLLESWLAETPALVHAESEVLQWQCRRSGAGLWFRTYAEFEEELSLLLNDPALGHKMGAAGREFVRGEYGWDNVERRFFEGLERFKT